MNRFFVLVFMFFSSVAVSQPVGYYNGTEGKTGDELKSELNNIISGHMEWYYFFAKNALLYSDADPSIPGNIITVYKGTSVDGTYYGTGGDFLNREHVWAKSHGQFGEEAPTGCDLHNLKPADGSVNVDRSNKDFDNCQATGTQHSEATGCYYTSTSWEPRDAVKGDIARIIFYMATRYEGENGDVDLEVNDEVDNSPDPFHGRLSALLEWNMQDLPDAFERNRNDVIFGYQQNRNPFIDNPQWVNMIWDGAAANSISIADVAQSQELVFVGDAVAVSAIVTGAGTVSAELHWGNTYTELTNTIAMTADGDAYTAQIPARAEESDVYFTIVATDDNGTYSPLVYHYHVEAVFAGTIKTIAEVQGEQAASPFADQEVTITGVVTGNFGDGFFVQDGDGAWDGVFVYDVLNPKVGDSVILTGTVKEYYELTEIVDVSDYYLISRGNELPEPVVLGVSDISEAYEGVLINIPGGTCTSVDEGYGLWEVFDNSGYLKIHNTPIYEFTPTLSETYSITGPCKWDYGEWKIELRSPEDISVGTDVIKPNVQMVEATSIEFIKCTFSEGVDAESAAQLENYIINNGVEVVDAYRHMALTNIVYLQVNGLSNGDYTITISDVSDVAGNVMETQTIAFTVGTGVENNVVQTVVVYPNPTADGVVTVASDLPIEQLQIFDVAGKRISEIDNGLNRSSIEVQLPHSGVYFIHATHASGAVEVIKVIAD